MSLIEDDALNGSVIGKTEPDVSNEQMKRGTRYQGTLRDRLIDWAINHPKCTRGDLFINVSGSGTCGTIITALLRAGVFEEHFFDCHSCKYITVDQAKVNIA